MRRNKMHLCSDSDRVRVRVVAQASQGNPARPDTSTEPGTYLLGLPVMIKDGGLRPGGVFVAGIIVSLHRNVSQPLSFHKVAD